MMFGRGSPKFVAPSKKMSPKACSTKRKGTSPKGCTSKRKGTSPKARASWTFEQEKTLVELFHEHNNPSFRGDNGWSTEAWNKITREMNEKHPYALFTKLQIQNKEKELKRDYRFLKEARMKSGISWDDSRKMVVAEPALWENILISFPKAKKFRSNRASFPLFDALGELHDGQTAEGTLNFTSFEPSQHPILTQVDNVDEPFERASTFLDIEERVDGDDDEDEISISTQQPEKTVGKDPMEVQGIVGKRVEKEPKKRKKVDVAGMMESYIAMKTKQAEEEAAARERAKADVDEFSIKKCIAVANEIEELTTEEKVDAFDVFMNEQKREIFLSADPSSRIMWLRRQLARLA
uniref:Myb/SANT-like domain-containing protein n=1 Tax=Hordeum vulgare subsp. vulgare TaxID=112509 RepID=A0A8I7BHZ4_HORVV